MSEKLRIYAATPSRLADRTAEICTFVAGQGNLPLHPFNAYPLAYFEGNPLFQHTPADRRSIRRVTMALCLEDVRRSHRFGLFGISVGTLEEVAEALKRRKPIDFHPEFDPLWEEEAKRLAAENSTQARTLRTLGIIS